MNYICLYANSAASLIDHHGSKPDDEFGRDVVGILCDGSSADGRNFETFNEMWGKNLHPSATATGGAEARKFLGRARDYEIPLSLKKTGNQDSEEC